MFKITCDYCDEDTIFYEKNQHPDFCKNCNTSFEGCEVAIVEEDSQQQTPAMDQDIHNGLILTYQKTGEKITIAHTPEIVIGREHIGSEILGKIPQVSREHCKIEYVDNQYLVTDLDSFNGTFVGVSKKDCRANPRQVLENNSLIYIGKEVFLINIKFSPDDPVHKCIAQEQIVVGSTESKEGKKQILRCRDCGNDVDQKIDICPSCGSFDTIEVA